MKIKNLKFLMVAALCAATIAFMGCSGDGETIDPDSVLQLVSVNPSNAEVDVDLRTFEQIQDPMTTQSPQDFYVTLFVTGRISDSTVTAIEADDILVTGASLSYSVAGATWSDSLTLNITVQAGASSSITLQLADVAFQTNNLSHLVGTSNTETATAVINITGQKISTGETRTLRVEVPVLFFDFIPDPVT